MRYWQIHPESPALRRKWRRAPGAFGRSIGSWPGWPGATRSGVRRFWLHQANLAMNQLIGRRLLGRDATSDEAPVILDEFANTASAGSIIAFHRHHDDFKAGEVGVISSFGAGYSIGSVVLRRT